jgi:hypothetical protein
MKRQRWARGVRGVHGATERPRLGYMTVDRARSRWEWAKTRAIATCSPRLELRWISYETRSRQTRLEARQGRFQLYAHQCPANGGRIHFEASALSGNRVVSVSKKCRGCSFRSSRSLAILKKPLNRILSSRMFQGRNSALTPASAPG